MESITYDILIRGGTILTMDDAMQVLEGFEIAILNGKIVALQTEGNSQTSAAQIIDARGCIVIPGLINAHSHLPMTYFRGLADDLPLNIWLNEYIWPLEAKLLKRDFIFDAALHGASEMIKNGITMTHDMYFDMPAIADACSKAGLRALIGEAIIELGDVSDDSLNFIGSKMIEQKAAYSSNPLIDFNLSPHAIYTCSRKTLERCAEVALQNDILLHMHLSESDTEVDNCIKQNGLRPVHYLKEIGFLDCRNIFAHGILINEEEMEILAQSHSSIAICTESNLKLCSGIAPLKAYHDHGINTCFATDGVASNNNLDLLAEMDITAKLHKTVNNDPAFLPAAETLKMATRNAARALGVFDKRGSIEIGKDADITILALDELNSQPIYNPYSHVVYALGARAVRDVIINGKAVLRDRKLVNVDESELIATAKRYKSIVSKELAR
ncbi:MAG: amidohydrolase family protein [Candidatus Cloacimonadaceae bacterium]|nr:amidohydrolase family protein [Candidatus Cloacimonadaceae bacterium]MDP3113791.1 amidohydrolase family protein [Candidatus Cloacimonadaceae bacterium]